MTEPCETKTYWNGEPCKARRVIAKVGIAAKPTYWYAPLESQEIRAVEVEYNGQKFMISDVDGEGWHKVTVGKGSPHLGHSSFEGEVLTERLNGDLDISDCWCPSD